MGRLKELGDVHPPCEPDPVSSPWMLLYKPLQVVEFVVDPPQPLLTSVRLPFPSQPVEWGGEGGEGGGSEVPKGGGDKVLLMTLFIFLQVLCN